MHYLAALFFDLEKVCHVAWPYGILLSLYRWSLGGHQPIWLSKFMTDCHLCATRIGPECHPFTIAISDITDVISYQVHSSFYTDDFGVYLWCTSVPEIGIHNWPSVTSQNGAGRIALKYLQKKTA
jgi:hypothetical protein